MTKKSFLFKNANGFSLSETMIALGVSTIIGLIASVAFLQAFDVYQRMARKYEAETEMLSLMQTLRSSFATGVNVSFGGLAIANNNFTTAGSGGSNVGVGRLYAINDVSVPAGGTDYSGGPHLVGMFNREFASSVAVRGNLSGVQIVYKRPNRVLRQSGALYIDHERNVALGNGWVRLSPINAPQMFTRITNFEVDNVKVHDLNGRIVTYNIATGGSPCTDNVGAPHNCVDRPVVSADVAMVMRYFTRGREDLWNWCNGERAALFPACAINTNSNYFDVERKMTAFFSNNAFDRNNYYPRRPFGNVYFFRPWSPLRRTQ
jgi:type II secretory pathway pseudopilin PulG